MCINICLHKFSFSVAPAELCPRIRLQCLAGNLLLSRLVVAIAKTATAMVSKRVIMSFLTSEHKDALSNNGAKSKSDSHSFSILGVAADDNMMQQCVGSLAQWFKCR
ncbi:hypothetical protein PVK06_016141 [Gossypium arboreum]|uniref:Uncharacterized protein n=1 Tax=Gossypium arboreum TaxID=29729 RepID=A0ABR0PZX4_GOSAR|nr:hypothetical protein PVK06_016141 [Gossypium arboreum]